MIRAYKLAALMSNDVFNQISSHDFYYAHGFWPEQFNEISEAMVLMSDVIIHNKTGVRYEKKLLHSWCLGSGESYIVGRTLKNNDTPKRLVYVNVWCHIVFLFLSLWKMCASNRLQKVDSGVVVGVAWNHWDSFVMCKVFLILYR